MGGILEDNIMLPNNKTIVTPRIRFDSSTNSKSNWSPSFNFSHQVSENWKIKGGVARSYKAPNRYQSSPNYLLINASNGCPIDSANHWNNPNALNSTGSVVKTDAKDSNILFFKTVIQKVLTGDALVTS